MTTRTCETCRMWVRGPDVVVGIPSNASASVLPTAPAPFGDCRKQAPRFDGRSAKAQWPVTRAGDFCGQWKTREEADHACEAAT
jgi:hypothetical protein